MIRDFVHLIQNKLRHYAVFPSLHSLSRSSAFQTALFLLGVLAFARAMGEFGCTLFFAGNYAGITQTIPIAIYFEWMGGNTSVALFWVVVVIAFSFLVILFINMYTAHSQKYRERGLSRAERKQAKQLGGQTDSLDPVGGDALRIDREALAELMRDDAVSKGGR